MLVVCPKCITGIPVADVDLRSQLAKCRGCDAVFHLDAKAVAPPVVCPNCRAGVPVEDVELSNRLAKCRRCNEVFSLTWDEVVTPQPRPSRSSSISVLSPVPRCFTVTSTADGGRLEYRWHNPFAYLYLAVLPLPLISAGLYFGGSGMPFFVLLLACAMPAPLIYSGLCMLVNRTVVEVGEEVRVWHGPLPWPGRVSVGLISSDVVAVEWALRGHDTSEGGLGGYEIILRTTVGGRRLILVLYSWDSRGLRNPVVGFVVQQLETWLGLPPEGKGREDRMAHAVCPKCQTVRPSGGGQAECQNCGEPFAPSDPPAQDDGRRRKKTARVVCPNCEEIQRISRHQTECRWCGEPLVIPEPPSPPPPALRSGVIDLGPPPARVSVTEDQGVRRIHVRTGTPTAVTFLALSIAGSAVFLGLQSWLGEHRDQLVLQISWAIAGVAWLVIGYYMACLLLNRTTITVDSAVRVESGPLPLSGGMNHPAVSVVALDCRLYFSDYPGAGRYQLHANTLDGSEVTLIRRMNFAQARFVCRTLEKWMTLNPTAIPGEAR
jgi:hypothetical protein